MLLSEVETEKLPGPKVGLEHNPGGLVLDAGKPQGLRPAMSSMLKFAIASRTGNPGRHPGMGDRLCQPGACFQVLET